MALNKKKKDTSDPAQDVVSLDGMAEQMEQELGSELQRADLRSRTQLCKLPIPHIHNDGSVRQINVEAFSALAGLEVVDELAGQTVTIVSHDQAVRLANAIVIAAKLKWQS